MNNINPNLNTNLFKKIKKSLLAKSKYNFCNFIFFLISISLILKILTSIFINSNWQLVTSNLNLYAFGSFPIDQQWRPTLWFFSLLSRFNDGNPLDKDFIEKVEAYFSHKWTHDRRLALQDDEDRATLD